MIIETDKTYILLQKLKGVLPVEVRLPPALVKDMALRDPGTIIPETCNVLDVMDLGPEGGIACALDVGGPETKNVHVISITSLRFNRTTPLFRDIELYQKHRNKKLKQRLSQDY